MQWRSLLANDKLRKPEDFVKRYGEASAEGADFWVAKAQLAARRGDMPKAKEILAEARKKLGDHIRIRFALALLALREMYFQAGPEIERLAGDADAFSAKDRADLWNGLVNHLMEIQEYDRAKGLCQKIARLKPHDAIIRYRLFELALVTHDIRDPAASLAELDRVLEEIDNIAGQGPLWMYGKGVRLKLEAAQGKPELLDEAMSCAKRRSRCGLPGRGRMSSKERFAASAATTRRPWSTTCRPRSTATTTWNSSASCCGCSSSGSGTRRPNR